MRCKAVVTRTSDVRPELIYGCFLCLKCGLESPEIEQQLRYRRKLQDVTDDRAHSRTITEIAVVDGSLQRTSVRLLARRERRNRLGRLDRHLAAPELELGAPARDPFRGCAAASRARLTCSDLGMAPTPLIVLACAAGVACFSFPPLPRLARGSAPLRSAAYEVDGKPISGPLKPLGNFVLVKARASASVCFARALR